MADVSSASSVVPFPLFHGTSTAFMPSIRAHGLGGKNIVAEWRILDFLRTGMSIIDSSIDRSDPTIGFEWKLLQAAASQRVDHLNWRHGGTYLIAAESRAVMYASSNPYRSELLGFVSWLLEHCSVACRPALDATLIHYPELLQCLRAKHEPLLIRAASVPVSSILTEKGEEAASWVRQLNDTLAKSKHLFDGISQVGAFELCEALAADSLQFFRVIYTADDDTSGYRLEALDA